MIMRLILLSVVFGFATHVVAQDETKTPTPAGDSVVKDTDSADVKPAASMPSITDQAKEKTEKLAKTID